MGNKDKDKSKEKKICKKCGHEVCPQCGDWCDVILYGKQDLGNHEDATKEDYPILCCNGVCEY